MVHPSDSQLLTHAQGEATPQTHAVAAHLRACVVCRQRLHALRSMWAHLGTWAAPAPPPDLETAILAALPPPAATPRRSAMLPRMRAAAAILLAAGIGHAAGRLTWRTPAPAPPPADASAAAAELHLDDAPTAQLLLAALDAPDGGQP